MTKALVVEIADSDGNWQDLTTSTMSVAGRIGLAGNRMPHAAIGRCNIVLDNSDPGRIFSPEVTTDNVELRRRTRVKYYGDNHGYCMRVTRTGEAGGGGNSVISDVQGSGDAFTYAPNWNAVNNTCVFQVFEVDRPGILTGITWRAHTSAVAARNLGCRIYAADTSNPDTIMPTGAALSTGQSNSPFTADTEYTITMSGTVYLEPYTKYVAWFYCANNSVSYSAPMEWTADSEYRLGYHATCTMIDGTSETNLDDIESLIYNKEVSLWMKVVTDPIEAYFKQQVSDSFVIGDDWVLTWEARAPNDTRWCSDDVYIVTSAETGAATTYDYTAEWASYTHEFTATINATTIEVRFLANDENPAGGNIRGIEYRNFELKKNGGSNVLTNGDFSAGTTTGWSVVDITGAETTLEAIHDYTYIFNGLIDSIEPSPFSYGDKQTLLRCLDYLSIYEDAELTLTLMQDQTMSAVATEAINTLKPGAAIGSDFDTGATFVLAGDRYRKQGSKIYDALKDLAVSEYGRVWVDRSGVLRMGDRNWRGKQATTAAALTLESGGTTHFDLPRVARRTDNIINKSMLTYYPRQTLDTGVIAQTQEILTIPPKNANGTPGILRTTIDFRDTAGNPIGADNVVTPPTLTTDITVWEFANAATNTYSGDYTSTRGQYWKDYYTVNGTHLDVVFENYCTGALHVAKGMTIRGDGVVIYDPITITKTDTDSIDTYKEVKYQRELPFFNNRNFADSLAQYFLNRYATPYSEVPSFTVTDRSDIGAVDLLALDLFDIVAITDDQTGLSAMKHQIIGIEFEFNPSNAYQTKKLTFELEQLDTTGYFRFGHATYGKFGTGKFYI